jgi:hypothetical protein
MQAVREAALLADVTISVWSGERTDQDMTDDIRRSAGATGNVGRFTKNLLAGVDGRLREVKSSFAAVRTTHYGLTLPWVSDPHSERQRGPRLLPHALFQSYLQRMGKQRTQALDLLEVFLSEYPDLVVKAQTNLAGLADANYPSVEHVRSSFKVKFDFEPIPAGQQFRGLPEIAIDRLAKGLQAKQERMLSSATSAMWQEVKSRVSHIVERLAEPDTKFKVSTVESLRELITVLPAWNMTDDARVTEVVDEIKDMLDGVQAHDLRKDPRTRDDVRTRAQQVSKRLSSWGV